MSLFFLIWLLSFDSHQLIMLISKSNTNKENVMSNEQGSSVAYNYHQQLRRLQAQDAYRNEAIANADAFLNNVVLPNYSELLVWFLAMTDALHTMQWVLGDEPLEDLPNPNIGPEEIAEILKQAKMLRRIALADKA
jgi:hypothetical protein